MPRISAPTLAEHRQRQVAALMAAARDVLLEQGLDGLTFAAVAARAGIARNTVYEYFAGRDDLLVALAEAEVPAWVEAVAAAMAAEPSPEDRLAMFVRVQLRMVATGEHRVGSMLMGVRLPPDADDRLHHVHAPMSKPLLATLAELGLPEPMLAARLVHGVTRAAALELDEGAPAEAVIELAVRLVLDGLARPGSPDRSGS
ncbi:MAG: TetR/AcrR family transcriptional regulator [Acidimicrobiales bacterium]|nr:TetR/AcrR family transcriptional regulator [Acidimicrobiales bacterium]